MNTKGDKSILSGRKTGAGKAIPPEYPLYPENEDIYSKFHKEKNLDPEDVSKTKDSNRDVGPLNEKDFEEDLSGSDLDIPGSELDDEQENIGSEDEENNYYSLGDDETI